MPVSSEAPSVAFWFLACVLLLVVALAGYGAGRLQQRALQRQALREARAGSHLLGQLLDVWRWQTDRHHRLVGLQPPAGAPASAWGPAEWGGQPLWERFVADGDALRAPLESMMGLSDVPVHPLGAPEAEAWLLRGVPRFDDEGQFEGYVGTARPHAAPPAAGTAALTLEGADSAGLLSEHAAFSYTVTHDLRAPIRVVEGFARILKEDYGRALDRIGNDHLDRVLAAAARMNSMIDALLTLANLSAQPLARQPVNLSQLAGFVVDDLRRAAPERQVEVEIAPGMLADGDPTLLRMRQAGSRGADHDRVVARQHDVDQDDAHQDGQLREQVRIEHRVPKTRSAVGHRATRPGKSAARVATVNLGGLRLTVAAGTAPTCHPIPPPGSPP